MKTANLPYGFEPADVFAHIARMAPTALNDPPYNTGSDYLISTTASPTVLADAIAATQSGDGLYHMRVRMISRIKNRASEMILARKSMPAQINQLARGLDLMFKNAEGDALTPEELDELRAGRAIYRDFVQPIRERSNQLEAALQGMSRDELLATDALNWPDALWPT